MKKNENSGLLFKFEIIDLHYRTLSVKIISMKKEIMQKEVKNIFELFMEDLVYFIGQQGYQKRWDFATIELFDINKLEFTKERLETFVELLKLVTNWEVIVKNENN